MPTGIYLHKPMTGRRKIGWELSKKTRKRISEGHRGEKNYLWKGDKASYISKHCWLYRELGKPSKCENCKTIKAKRFEWANKSGKYKRDLTDWIRLCVLCHRRWDRGLIHLFIQA